MKLDTFNTSQLKHIVHHLQGYKNLRKKNGKNLPYTNKHKPYLVDLLRNSGLVNENNKRYLEVWTGFNWHTFGGRNKNGFIYT